MSFPLSRSLWMKWRLPRKKKNSIKEPRLKPVEAATGGEGDGDERAIVLALPVDTSFSLQLQMQLPRLEAVGGEGDGDGRAIVSALPVDTSSSLQLQLQMQQPRLLMVMMDASLFHCASCSQILKPPTFKCDAGHVVCEDCIGSHVAGCTDAVSKIRRPCSETDRMLRGAKVSCAHQDRGCADLVPYYELADHIRSCRFAPSCVVGGNLQDTARTAAASASGSPAATRPKRERRPNPRYAGPSWTK